MGRRIVRISPEIIQELVTQGHTIGEGCIVRTKEGVPEGATLLRCWIEQEWHPDGCIVMLFEHPSWSETVDGTHYQTMTPMFTRELSDVPTETLGGRVFVNGR